VRLPPPDPNEGSYSEPDAPPFDTPTVVFVGGTPSRSAQRLADAILTARPGVLIVVAGAA
jgi:hypothetical protein